MCSVWETFTPYCNLCDWFKKPTCLLCPSCSVVAHYNPNLTFRGQILPLWTGEKNGEKVVYINLYGVIRMSQSVLIHSSLSSSGKLGTVDPWLR
jgi:hypothetical protein